MRIGLQIPSFSYPNGTERISPRMAEIGGPADGAGYASIWETTRRRVLRAVAAQPSATAPSPHSASACW